MLRSFFLLLAALSSTCAYASEAKVKATLERDYPQIGKIQQVNKSPLPGLYEVVTQGQLLYTDEKAQYIINGNIFELKSGRNLTDERSRKLFAIDFNALPFELALKKVKGNGQRKMAYFSDPNCSFCRKLENELKNVDNVTLYLFLYPVFEGSDVKVRNVACSKNPFKAWDDLMLNNVQPPVGTCNASADKALELGKKFNVSGTPTLIFADGTLVPGYLPGPELEKALNGTLSR
ncbi:MAG: thiol:disulfide interchange protein [Gallionellales bacterium RBG_16_56_9]|nr:MAG: thiol:disulfide interchange protein [Gallionellales bacterium RBG_16_56_9]